MFWVYILENSEGKSHNRTDRVSGKFTRKNGPWHLVWSERHPRDAAQW
jgi:hypothetical protein